MHGAGVVPPKPRPRQAAAIRGKWKAARENRTPAAAWRPSGTWRSAPKNRARSAAECADDDTRGENHELSQKAPTVDEAA